MKRCYGYIRVSTHYQVEDGLSLEFQEKEMIEYAKRKNLELVKIYKDKAKSGRQVKGRKDLQEVLQIIRRGEVLLFYTLSRLARNNRECKIILNDLEERGCLFASVKENIETVTAMGRAMVGMITVFDELESDIISERVKDGMKMKKERGEFYGRISYGWKLSNGKGSDLVEVAEEQEVITQIKKMKTDRETVNNIIKYLEDNNISPPKTSKKWHTSTIYGIVNRPPINTKGRTLKY
jgi:site-specific DNA recombinase